MTAEDHLELLRIVDRLREMAVVETDPVRRAVLVDLLAVASGAELMPSGQLGRMLGVADWRIREVRQEVRAEL